jgi:hypothetical protein
MTQVGATQWPQAAQKANMFLSPPPPPSPPPSPSSINDARFLKVRRETNAQTDVVIYAALVVSTMGLIAMVMGAMLRSCCAMLYGNRLSTEKVMD